MSFWCLFRFVSFLVVYLLLSSVWGGIVVVFIARFVSLICVFWGGVSEGFLIFYFYLLLLFLFCCCCCYWGSRCSSFDIIGSFFVLFLFFIIIFLYNFYLFI